MCYDFELCSESDKSIDTFHLAEGPGGFIEAIAHKRNNIGDTYYGMTLLDDNPSVPAWKKSGEFL